MSRGPTIEDPSWRTKDSGRLRRSAETHLAGQPASRTAQPGRRQPDPSPAGASCPRPDRQASPWRARLGTRYAVRGGAASVPELRPSAATASPRRRPLLFRLLPSSALAGGYGEPATALPSLAMTHLLDRLVLVVVPQALPAVVAHLKTDPPVHARLMLMPDAAQAARACRSSPAGGTRSHGRPTGPGRPPTWTRP